MISKSRKALNAVFVGGLFFILSISFFTAAYVIVGVFTGVVGLCAAAPEWWSNIYEQSTPIVPLASLITAILLTKKCLNYNSEELSDETYGLE